VDEVIGTHKPSHGHRAAPARAPAIRSQHGQRSPVGAGDASAWITPLAWRARVTGGPDTADLCRARVGARRPARQSGRNSALCNRGAGPGLGNCRPLECRTAPLAAANRDALLDSVLASHACLPPCRQHTLAGRHWMLPRRLAPHTESGVHLPARVSGGAVSLVTRRGSSKQAWMVGTVTIKGVAARRRGGAPGRRHRGGPGIFRGGLASIPPVAEETIWHGLRPVHGGRAPG
jgi:hypothetical protein